MWPEAHAQVDPLSTKFWAVLQVRHTLVDEQVKQPSIVTEHCWQFVPLRAYPLVQLHLLPLETKFPAVLQVVQIDVEEQVRHPTMVEPQVTQLEPLTAYPEEQDVHTLAELHVTHAVIRVEQSLH